MTILCACLLTVIIETGFFIILGYFDRKFLILCICANILTNIVLNMTLLVISYAAPSLGEQLAILVYPLEIAAAAAEYYIFSRYLGRSKKLLLLVILANLVSYIAGIFIFGHV